MGFVMNGKKVIVCPRTRILYSLDVYQLDSNGISKALWIAIR